MAAHTFLIYLKYNLFIVFTIIAVLVENSYQDILGCGGFLKSQVPVDFSRVEIKLYTKQGTLKDSSDCAPTNGYYFIPVYDKGEYVLKVQPPKDWHFEPMEVHLNFDGVNDPCSKANDINFIFQGFTLQGKVNSPGTTDGPGNILVSLVSENDKSFKLTTYTESGGNYRFAPLLPGKYFITASHDKFKFSKHSTVAVVKNENLFVPQDSLVVAGYDITGQVLFNGEPTMGVKFVLTANDERNRNIKVVDCSNAPLPNFGFKDFLCHVSSDEQGIFEFKQIPPGTYKIRPHYGKFDVQPKETTVFVKHDHLHLSNKFLVKGFSVSGRVLTSIGGPGLKNAEIYLNNEKITVTDHEGKYILDGMEPGNYVLSVRSENVRFDDVTIKLSPNTPEVVSVYPSEFKVCGLVTPASIRQPTIVEIWCASDKGKPVETAVDRDTGKFCRFLKPGRYNIAVKLSDLEKSSGMQYLPLVREVFVKNNPISDIEFTQLRGTIQGRIVKLPESTKAIELSVKLKLKNSVVAMKVLEGNALSYHFDDVLPGFYDVELENNLWCFQNDFHSVSVTSAKTVVPDFHQTGFKINIKCSHDTAATIASESPENKYSQNVTLKRGDNTRCLPHANAYRVVPVGCHGYDKDFYVIDTKQGANLHLVAESHDITGYVKSSEPEADMAVEVVNAKGEMTKMGPLRSEKSDDSFIYRFTYRSAGNELLKFVPISHKLLFQPEFVELRTVNDCLEDAVRFSGERGLIIEGGINPPLSNVKVVLKIEDYHTGGSNLTVITKSDGRYKFGPLRSTMKFDIVAEKESYNLIGPDKNGMFTAHKLAEINVKVIDNATKEPLQGVLLSLTGGEKYRKNSITVEGGLLSFHSLSPGEYFLRPMMKEYKFEPASQIIHIREGITKSIELRGKRVSFSVYGTVSSLNGDAESEVVVEAVGRNACSNLQEEASSEANGQFRIRGLVPQCEYQIRLKREPEVNVHIHRLEPQEIMVKTDKGDVRNIQLIAFHLVNQMDISVHVESTVPEHLKTLKLKLCKESEPYSPVFAVKLDTLAGGAKNWGSAASQERFLKAGLLVQLPFVPRDQTPYFIQLESTLSKHTYSYKEPAVHFTADKTFRNFKILFEPAVKALDHELTKTNYIVVPFLILSALFYVHFNKVMPFVQNLIGVINQASFSLARDERNFYTHGNPLVDNVNVEPVVVPAKRKTKPRKT